MGRVKEWLITSDLRMFSWLNRRHSKGIVHLLIGKWLSFVTHMGGAAFTLITALLYALLAPEPWNTTGWQCLAAVMLSHIPVSICKRKFKRLRPYQAMPGNVFTCPKPLQDPSFPSGHTTAIFAWLVPILLTSGGIWLSMFMPVALLIGISVAWSRMYLGLHYPSDVAAGALIGTLTAIAVTYLGLTLANGLL